MCQPLFFPLRVLCLLSIETFEAYESRCLRIIFCLARYHPVAQLAPHQVDQPLQFTA